MDARLEIIDNIRIGIECEMEAVLKLDKKQSEGLQMELHAITQCYLLLRMLDILEHMDKTLNLIAIYTSTKDV